MSRPQRKDAANSPPALRIFCTVRARLLLAASLTVLVASWSAPGFAHDANLATWEVSVTDADVELELRTSGHGLYAACEEAGPCAGLAGQSYGAWDLALAAFIRDAVRLRAADGLLDPEVLSVTHGHEATLRMRFVRPEGSGAALELDLSGFTSRSGQHHLVFLNDGGTRHRVMLAPESPPVLRWQAGEGLPAAASALPATAPPSPTTEP